MNIAEGLQSVEIGSDRLQLVAAAGDAICRVRQIKPEHLRGRTLLLRESGSSTRAGAENLLSQHLKEFERVLEVPAPRRSNRLSLRVWALLCFRHGRPGWRRRPECFSRSEIHFCDTSASFSW
jgi:DNA-binding transcriptional LysR family regulator